MVVGGGAITVKLGGILEESILGSFEFTGTITILGINEINNLTASRQATELTACTFSIYIYIKQPRGVAPHIILTLFKPHSKQQLILIIIIIFINKSHAKILQKD